MRGHLLFILFLFSQHLFSSVGEVFGPSALSASLGNQFIPDTSDAANNFHLPALLAFDPKSHSSLNFNRINSKFTAINSVVTENSLTANTNAQGKVETDYEGQNTLAAHLSLPIGDSKKSIFALSVFSPIGPSVETQSGDPFQPEYVLYRSRFSQTQIYFNYGRKLNEKNSLSLGAYTGIQVSSRVESRASLNATSSGSSASMQAEAKPTLAGRLSYAYKWNPKNITGLNLSQEMKSNLEVLNVGETVNPNFLYDLRIKSLLHYSPWEVKLTHSHSYGQWNFLGTIEYQIWQGYKPPTIRIENLGGNIQSSDDFESISLRNIFIARLGSKYQLTDRWSLMVGLSYRQTPLEGDFSGAGNSLDANSYMVSLGTGYRFGKNIDLIGSVQTHELESRKVTKSSGLEDGSAGSKVGSPGYEIGGRTTSLSLGLQFYL